MGTCAAGLRAVLVTVADGVDRAGPVTVKDEGLGVADLMDAVGVRNVGAVAPAQPAKTNTSVAAPVRERAAYPQGCLTGTHSIEPTDCVDNSGASGEPVHRRG